MGRVSRGACPPGERAWLRFGFVYLIRQADRLALCERGAESPQFVGGQKSFAALFTVFLQALNRVVPLGD